MAQRMREGKDKKKSKTNSKRGVANDEERERHHQACRNPNWLSKSRRQCPQHLCRRLCGKRSKGGCSDSLQSSPMQFPPCKQANQHTGVSDFQTAFSDSSVIPWWASPGAQLRWS